MKSIIAISVLFILRTALCAQPFFIMDAGGLIGYCGETEYSRARHSYFPTYVAGAAGELVLEISANSKPPRGFEPWLPTLEISIGYWDSTADECNYDGALKDQLQLRLIRASGWGEGPENPTLNYLFVLPSEMADRKICFNAYWHDSPWGDLKSMTNMLNGNEILAKGKPHPMIISVIAPCNEADAQRARESHVFEAWISGNHAETARLADSLMSHGHGSFSVYSYASMAAQGLGQFDRAIAFLDTCYQQYGRAGAVSDSASQAREYQQMRSRVLELKAKREEQQR